MNIILNSRNIIHTHEKHKRKYEEMMNFFPNITENI